MLVSIFNYVGNILYTVLTRIGCYRYIGVLAKCLIDVDNITLYATTVRLLEVLM